MTVEWLSRTSFFEERSKVKLLWDVGVESGETYGVAGKIKLDSLILGENYTVVLVDDKFVNVSAAFNFVACE